MTSTKTAPALSPHQKVNAFLNLYHMTFIILPIFFKQEIEKGMWRNCQNKKWIFLRRVRKGI